MWLPENIYNRLPYIWLVAGVLFIAAALYMSFAYKWSIWYFGAGVSCCLFGLILLMLRSRKEPGPQADDEPA